MFLNERLQHYGHSYARIRVSCPHHKNCIKNRNVGMVQTRAYGPMQPYAFLGAWLQCAGRFTDARGHVKWSPDIADEEAYMRHRNWLPNNVRSQPPSATA